MAAVSACREVWDAVSRWSIWVTLAIAGRELGQTEGGEAGHSTGEVTQSWGGNGGCCTTSQSVGGRQGGIRAGLRLREDMRLQAVVSGDQGHSARPEAYPFRTDMKRAES